MHPALLHTVARIARLKTQGRTVINLATGEPDFGSPAHVRDPAQGVMEAVEIRYMAGGCPSLKRAIIHKFAVDNDLYFSEREVMASCDSRQVALNLVQAVIRPGDRVVIPAPCRPSFVDMVRFADGEPVTIPTSMESEFKLRPEQLGAAIDHRTRLFIINSPANPTGAVHDARELASLGAVLRRHPQVLILSDDRYEQLLLDDSDFVHLLNVCPDLRDRTVLLNGASGAGWCVGFAAGPEAIIAAMARIQSQGTSHPDAAAQAAAGAALTGDRSWMRPVIAGLREHHRFVVGALNGMEGVRCLPAAGGFYVFAEVERAVRRMHERGRLQAPSDEALCDLLLEEGGLATVPGSLFGTPGHLRISFTASMAALAQAMANMRAVLFA